MRVSIDNRDSGFAKLQEWGGPRSGIKVFLNGEEVRDIITADEEQGEIFAYVYEDAEQKRLKTKGDEVVREWRRGKVEISMLAQAAEVTT